MLRNFLLDELPGAIERLTLAPLEWDRMAEVAACAEKDRTFALNVHAA
jgi:hypothetical protein